jgi:hypothetical protein
MIIRIEQIIVHINSDEEVLFSDNDNAKIISAWKGKGTK